MLEVYGSAGVDLCANRARYTLHAMRTDRGLPAHRRRIVAARETCVTHCRGTPILRRRGQPQLQRARLALQTGGQRADPDFGVALAWPSGLDHFGQRLAALARSFVVRDEGGLHPGHRAALGPSPLQRDAYCPQGIAGMPENKIGQFDGSVMLGDGMAQRHMRGRPAAASGAVFRSPAGRRCARTSCAARQSDAPSSRPGCMLTREGGPHPPE